MSKTPLPPYVMEHRRMARLKAAGASALTVIALLLLAAPWVTRYALHWSAEDSVALGIVTCLAGLMIGAITVGLICDAAYDYNGYRRSIDKLHWDKHQQAQELITQIHKEEGLK